MHRLQVVDVEEVGLAACDAITQFDGGQRRGSGRAADDRIGVRVSVPEDRPVRVTTVIPAGYT